MKRNRKTESRGGNGHRPAVSSRPQEKYPDHHSSVNEGFRRFAHKSSEIVGNPWSFIIAATSLVVWGIMGPAAGFSDTWQLLINTATTIITFLMVFLIQNTQNRDAKAIHLKLDELIHAMKGARDSLIDLEDLSDERIKKIQDEFKRMGNASNAPSQVQPDQKN